jgi:hypothetical protein
MKLFYGNFDRQKQTSTVTFSHPDSVRVFGEQMLVRPLFHASIGDEAHQGFVLLTYAVPQRDEQYYCHACAPTLGMAVFEVRGSEWTLTASNRAVTDAGGYGKPPSKVKLTRIGPNHDAVQVEDTDQGGQRTTVLLILAPWHDTVTVALERIIGDDDKGMCEPKGLPCYSNNRSLKFLSNPTSDYNDVELTLTGTDLPASENPKVRAARKVAGVEHLRFESGKYEQVSRSGDLTTVDRVVAQREHLQ